VPVLRELVEPEGRVGERGEHGSVAGRVADDEGLPATAPLQFVFLAAPDRLISVGIDRE